MRQKINNNQLTFRVCVYLSDLPDHFTAHCLELDVVGEDKTVEGAIGELLECIESQIESCNRNDAQLQFFAPPEVFGKYTAAKKANRRIGNEMLERIARNANKRMGHDINLLDDVIGAEGIPDELLAAV